MDSSLLRVTPRALMLLTRLMPVMSDGGATWMLRVPRGRKMISADLDWLIDWLSRVNIESILRCNKDVFRTCFIASAATPCRNHWVYLAIGQTRAFWYRRYTDVASCGLHAPECCCRFSLAAGTRDQLSSSSSAQDIADNDERRCGSGGHPSVTEHLLY